MRRARRQGLEANRQGNHPCPLPVLRKEGGGSSLGIFERMVMPIFLSTQGSDKVER